MSVLQFKFDESYDGQIMCVGGWIANELEWTRLESRWQRRIEFENSRSPADQQITEFHATEMNCKGGEYRNWTHSRCVQFSKHLIRLLDKRKMGAIAVACDMDAIQQVFPKGDTATMKRRTYILCIKELMVDIAHAMESYFPGDTVLLVHDRGSWDEDVLRGYNLMIEEPEWKRRHVFEGLANETGRNCIGLQAADLIAYEVFKGIKRQTNSPDAAMRGAMQEMLKREIPMRARWINLNAAEALYRIMKDSGKYPNLDEMGVT